MKSRRKKNIDQEIEQFGKDADKKTSQAIFKRFSFSLTAEVSDEIDELTLVTKRVSRSDIIKAGIKALKALSKEEQVRIITQLK